MQKKAPQSRGANVQSHHADLDIPWDTRDAAAYLGMGKWTLEAWRCRGGGPKFYKFGRSVRYYKSDLDVYRAQSERRSTSDTGRV
jgi:excisionase family DNA binding protein